MKVHWGDLSEEEQNRFSGECGVGKRILRIPQFIFKASCKQHDFYYQRGGGLWDKLEADIMFFAFMVKDINEKDCHWFWKFGYMAGAKTYFFAVILLGWGFFTWGVYKTKEDILHG